MSNDRIRERCGKKKNMVEKAEECLLKLFKHMERISEEGLM